MKLKLLAFTLLIGMISFAGFSLTTTDLCQDSSIEYDVSIEMGESVQTVVDSFVEVKTNAELTDIRDYVIVSQDVGFAPVFTSIIQTPILNSNIDFNIRIYTRTNENQIQYNLIAKHNPVSYLHRYRCNYSCNSIA